MLRMRATHAHLDERRIGQKASKDVILVAVSPVFGIREEAGVLTDIAVDGALELAVGLRDGDDLLRVGNGEEPQSSAIQNGEDAGVQPDAERQGKDGYGGESRVLPERASTESQVAQKILE